MLFTQENHSLDLWMIRYVMLTTKSEPIAQARASFAKLELPPISARCWLVKSTFVIMHQRACNQRRLLRRGHVRTVARQVRDAEPLESASLKSVLGSGGVWKYLRA